MSIFMLHLSLGRLSLSAHSCPNMIRRIRDKCARSSWERLPRTERTTFFLPNICSSRILFPACVSCSSTILWFIGSDIFLIHPIFTSRFAKAVAEGKVIRRKAANFFMFMLPLSLRCARKYSCSMLMLLSLRVTTVLWRKSLLTSKAKVKMWSVSEGMDKL